MKRQRETSPDHDRRSYKKYDSYKNQELKVHRDSHRNHKDDKSDAKRDNVSNIRDKSSRDRNSHNYNDNRRVMEVGERRKMEYSPTKRGDDHSRHRDHSNGNKRNRNFHSYERQQNGQRKFRKSYFEDSHSKPQSSPDWGKPCDKKANETKVQDKEKPNFGLSGKLTEDANTVNGVVIKYAEPADARKPKRRWRLYPFKGEKALPVLYIHRQSAYLMGRDRKIADIPLDHPSVSKQHAALQYRLVSYKKDNGGDGKRIRPYIIDLDSANGTFVNDVKLEPRRYHELLERDVVKFGFSTREYVVLHEMSKDDSLDDDVPAPTS